MGCTCPWIWRHMTWWRLYSGAYISDQESGKNLYGLNIQLHPVTEYKLGLWTGQTDGAYNNTTCTAVLILMRECNVRENWRVKQTLVFVSSLWERKHLTKEEWYNKYSFSTFPAAHYHNLQKPAYGSVDQVELSAYGLVRWQRLSCFHKFIFKIHSWHDLHITNISGGECVLQSRSFIYKVF